MTAKQTLTQRIDSLFTYRRIPELLRMAGIEPDSPFVERLYRLQEAIYGLDLYLESGWKLDKKKRREHWNAIDAALRGFGIDKSSARKFTAGIKRYEDYELALHRLKIPMKLSFRKMYGYKSCDIKLMRRLIYRHAPGLEKELGEQDWVYYDLIAEIDDDIHDVYEDCETINGNRFIISLLLSGKRKTRRAYRNFLNEIAEDARKHFKKKKRQYPSMLYTWTRECLLETEELLRATMDDQKLSLVGHGELARKILKGKSQKLKS